MHTDDCSSAYEGSWTDIRTHAGLKSEQPRTCDPNVLQPNEQCYSKQTCRGRTVLAIQLRQPCSLQHGDAEVDIVPIGQCGTLDAG